jgi:hypothetical protein
MAIPSNHLGAKLTNPFGKSLYEFRLRSFARVGGTESIDSPALRLATGHQSTNADDLVQGVFWEHDLCPAKTRGLLPPSFPNSSGLQGQPPTGRQRPNNIGKYGAGDGIRTHDPNLGKVVLLPSVNVPISF